MKKLSIFFITICSLIGLSLITPHTSKAAIPDVYGRVVNGLTNAPISGVWVEWKNGKSCLECKYRCATGQTCTCAGDGYSSRYAQTDSNGNFLFTAYDILPDSDYGIMVDTDLDGTPDVEQIKKMATYCDGSFDKNVLPDFGCGTNPQLYKVVMPKGWTGTFTSLGGSPNPAICSVCINNGSFSHDAGTIYYYPGGVPTPTPEICNVPSPTSPSEWWSFKTQPAGVKRCGVLFNTTQYTFSNSTFKVGLTITNQSTEDKHIILAAYACRCLSGNGGAYSAPFCKGYEPQYSDTAVANSQETGNCVRYQDEDITLKPNNLTYLFRGITQYDGVDAGSMELGYIGVSINGQSVCPEGPMGTDALLGQGYHHSNVDVPACIAVTNPLFPTPTTPPGATPLPTNTPMPAPTQILFPAELKGSVYLDVNNSCTYDAGDIPGNDVSLNLDRLLPNSCGQYNETITPIPNGTYGFNDLDCFSMNSASYRLRMTSNSPLYSLNCGNVYNFTTIPGQHIIKDIGLTILRDPWIQTYRGGIHANGTISSAIPPTAIDKNLIRSDANNSPDVGSATSITTDNGTVSSNNWKAANYQQNNTLQFSMESLEDQLIPMADNNNYNGQPPTSQDALSDGVAVYYANKNNITINGNWQDINFPVIVIVKGSTSGSGDITIKDNITNHMITLGPQGFLMMIAERDIIVENGIGESTNSSTTPNLEGIFVAGRNFYAGGTGDRTVDTRLNVSGTVITGVYSSGSYISNRTHEDNHLYPSDYFIFNPKLLLNTPAIVSQPIYNWTETRH
ncbi:hypothetical protein HGA91_02760 [candidate division WWE3 bacterium]|nr:hypothetical protein [candidate division WWE3 bacterium]